MLWQAALARRAGFSLTAAILIGVAAGLIVLWLAYRMGRPAVLLGI